MMKCNRDCFNCIYDDCIADFKSDYYQNNRERIIANTKKWKQEHPEQAKEQIKRYYREHREERLAYFKERYRLNKLKKVQNG